MTTTTISTEARRIVRAARGYRPGFRLYFDATGHLVSAIYGPEAFGPQASTYAIACDHTITQREAQAQLDDYAHAIAATGWDRMDVEQYMTERAMDRAAESR